MTLVFLYSLAPRITLNDNKYQEYFEKLQFFIKTICINVIFQILKAKELWIKGFLSFPTDKGATVVFCPKVKGFIKWNYCNIQVEIRLSTMSQGFNSSKPQHIGYTS